MPTISFLQRRGGGRQISWCKLWRWELSTCCVCAAPPTLPMQSSQGTESEVPESLKTPWKNEGEWGWGKGGGIGGHVGK